MAALACVVLFGVLCVPAAEGAAREDRRGLLEFMQAQRARRYRHAPRKVLAFYYTWYGTPERHGRWVHWADVQPEARDIATSTHYPARGAYDSHDPAVVDWHIELAKGHGVDGFIATWWGQDTFDDRAFRLLLDRARGKDFAVTLYWETAPGEGRAQRAQAVDDLAYVLHHYGTHPAFLKVDGKPVIFVYGRVMSQVALEQWPAIVAAARQRAGTDFLLVADGYREAYARLFDGVHTYNICGWVRDRPPEELARLSRERFSQAVSLAKRHGRIACITLIPGYDDTKIRTPGLRAPRQDGATYRVLWEQAIAADPDWVLITSWNEWHEGSEIEPSVEHGRRYLQMTAAWAKRFKSTPHSRVPVPETPATAPAETARRLRTLYEGMTVGVLPGFGGAAVFWLADCGVSLRALSWQDVLDPAVLNVRTLPILLYASGERYVQSVQKPGDVDAALVRYLREGGLLVAVPTQPFPFYYNEKGEAVVSAARLGLPMAGRGAPATVRGWEEPPEGVELRFQVDTAALPGLPATAPFPESGDRRWRPCTGAALPEGDEYLPLARLVDGQGVRYGDGIAFVHHKASEPKGGKCLVVWMRMPDVLDRDRLFFHLFRLAAEKATRAE